MGSLWNSHTWDLPCFFLLSTFDVHIVPFHRSFNIKSSTLQWYKSNVDLVGIKFPILNFDLCLSQMLYSNKTMVPCQPQLREGKPLILYRILCFGEILYFMFFYLIMSFLTFNTIFHKLHQTFMK